MAGTFCALNNNQLIHNMQIYSGFLRLLTNTKPLTLPKKKLCLHEKTRMCVRRASTIYCVHSCETKCTVSTLILHAESF